MSRLFPNLFSPLDIKGIRFKNRLFFAAHGTGYAEDGGVGSAGNECYRARVTRGPGLLVTEATQVVPLPKQKNAQLAHADSVFFRHIMPGNPGWQKSRAPWRIS